MNKKTKPPVLAQVSKQDYPRYYKQGNTSFTKLISEKQAVQVKTMQTQTSITRTGNKHLIQDVEEYGELITAEQFRHAYATAEERINN